MTSYAGLALSRLRNISHFVNPNLHPLNLDVDQQLKIMMYYKRIN